MTYAYNDIVTAKDIRTGKVRKEDIIGKQGWFFNTIPSDMSEDAIECIEPSRYGVLNDIAMNKPFPFRVTYDGWGFFLPEKKKPYEERQAEWVKENDIQDGDKVRLLRKAEDHEDGWGCYWGTGIVGDVGKIIGLDSLWGVRVSFSESSYWYPFFVLEKVKEEYIPFDLSLQEDRDALRDRWIRCRQTGSEYRISAFKYRDDYGWKAHTPQVGLRDGEQLFNNYEFLDGSHVGKKEEA